VPLIYELSGSRTVVYLLIVSEKISASPLRAVNDISMSLNFYRLSGRLLFYSWFGFKIASHKKGNFYDKPEDR
jgi:hypothetical protein